MTATSICVEKGIKFSKKVRNFSVTAFFFSWNVLLNNSSSEYNSKICLYFPLNLYSLVESSSSILMYIFTINGLILIIASLKLSTSLDFSACRDKFFFSKFSMSSFFFVISVMSFFVSEEACPSSRWRLVPFRMREKHCPSS
jgi:MFS-type transporter involved in bile tolerance (Atg22 family)